MTSLQTGSRQDAEEANCEREEEGNIIIIIIALAVRGHEL